MVTPTVMELPLRLEPVGSDPFVSRLRIRGRQADALNVAPDVFGERRGYQGVALERSSQVCRGPVVVAERRCEQPEVALDGA
jgi:hypothetical protein